MLSFLILGKQNLSQVLILIICSFLSSFVAWRFFKEFLVNVSSPTNGIDCSADVARQWEKANFLLLFAWLLEVISKVCHCKGILSNTARVLLKESTKYDCRLLISQCESWIIPFPSRWFTPSALTVGSSPENLPLHTSVLADKHIKARWRKREQNLGCRWALVTAHWKLSKIHLRIDVRCIPTAANQLLWFFCFKIGPIMHFRIGQYCFLHRVIHLICFNSSWSYILAILFKISTCQGELLTH